jgi:hypothetical protein
MISLRQTIASGPASKIGIGPPVAFEHNCCNPVSGSDIREREGAFGAMKLSRKVWHRLRELLPVKGFCFDRPIVLLQSDDWGRAGLRDREGFELLRSAGLELGQRPYDFHSLETAEDISELRHVLRRHRDSTGRCPCMGVNFVVANLDLKRMAAQGLREIHLLPLAEGLPDGWNRLGLLQAYRDCVGEGFFYPALHGTTHFCRAVVERHLNDAGERGELLRRLWDAGTPYIHWRMPWIGYEYWDPEQPEDERFLSAAIQSELIGSGVGAFAKLFSAVPRSACAPGYRANEDTHRAWAEYGIRVAQNGPGTLMPPHSDRHGMLQLYRNVDFEPAVDPSFSVERCVRDAEDCFALGIPAIVSLHSINFHSSVRDFRSRTLEGLDLFFSTLEAKHPDVLYLHDEDLYNLVSKGAYESIGGVVRVKVTQKSFAKGQLSKRQISQ